MAIVSAPDDVQTILKNAMDKIVAACEEANAELANQEGYEVILGRLTFQDPNSQSELVDIDYVTDSKRRSETTAQVTDSYIFNGESIDPQEVSAVVYGSTEQLAGRCPAGTVRRKIRGSGYPGRFVCVPDNR